MSDNVLPDYESTSTEVTSGDTQLYVSETQIKEETLDQEIEEHDDFGSSQSVGLRLIYDENDAQSDEFQEQLYSRFLFDEQSGGNRSFGGLLCVPEQRQCVDCGSFYTGTCTTCYWYQCSIESGGSNGGNTSIGSNNNKQEVSSSCEVTPCNLQGSFGSPAPPKLCHATTIVGDGESSLVLSGTGSGDKFITPIQSYTSGIQSQKSSVLYKSKKVGLSRYTSKYQSNKNSTSGRESVDISCQIPNKQDQEFIRSMQRQRVLLSDTICTVSCRRVHSCWCGAKDCLGHFYDPISKNRSEGCIQEVRVVLISFSAGGFVEDCMVTWTQWYRQDRVGYRPVRACLFGQTYRGLKTILAQPTSRDSIRRFCFRENGCFDYHPLIRSIEALDDQCETWVCAGTGTDSEDIYFKQKFGDSVVWFKPDARA